jgi:lipoate-protein ligase A
MRRITEQVDDAEDQLALDEALLLEADDNGVGEALRLWEFSQPTVVLGRSSKVDREVDREYCESRGIPILRRCSGGASVVGGPGCLMYSVVLSLGRHHELRKIDVAHRYVMGRVLEAVRRQLPAAEFQGTCDLTWNDRKCSGNSLRIARDHLLYHGTVLYNADLDLIAGCLADAPRQPDYRAGRDHREFVTNIPADRAGLETDLADVFDAHVDPDFALPRARMRHLRRQRYDLAEWHLRH